MALQHLRSSTANKRPLPAGMSDGQLAINTNNTSPGVFFKNSAGALVKVGPVHVGATAPNASPASGGETGNTVGEQWLDTSGTNPVLKIWDGSVWQSEAGEFVNVSGDTMTGALVMDNQQQVRFRETTANGTNYVAIQAPASVGADRTLTLPDVSGTIVSTGDTGTVTSTMIVDGTIVNGDINASAAIAGTKISPDFGSQTITTTGVVSAAAGAAATPSIAFTGDLNTGLYSPGADQVAISTNGTGRLFVDASGNVCLKKEPTNPNYSKALTVVATDAAIALRANSTGTYSDQGIFFAVDGVNYSQIYNDSTGQLIFRTGSGLSERLRITSAGLVGVGTSSPGTYLDTRGFASYRGNAYTIASFCANNTLAPLNICQSENGTHPAISAGQNSSGVYQPLVFMTSEQKRMNIDAAGNVGIGTTSPSAQLHVQNTGGNSESIVGQYGTGVQAKIGAYADGIIVDAANSGSTSAQQNLRFSINGSEAARFDSSRRLLVGTSTSTTGVAFASQIQSNAFYAYSASLFSADNIGSNTWFLKSRNATVNQHTAVQSGDVLGRINFAGSDGDEFIHAALIQAVVDNGAVGTAVSNNECPAALVFSTTADGASSPTERMRITNFGELRAGGNISGINIGSTTDSGFVVENSGTTVIYRTSSIPLFLGRQADDGTLVEFRQAGAIEGTISVSGTTVSYNGGHLSRWSQLPSGEQRTEILRGTVLSNIDEMCEWGDEDNEQLNRMKVSDVEGDKNVSGVFQAWDDDDDTYTNDFYCAMTGDFVIRIAAGVTVERGDLLMSAGDGTAKPQDDDIIRSKTIAKVTSTNVSCTYPDGSYCVPCVLMAC